MSACDARDARSRIAARLQLMITTKPRDTQPRRVIGPPGSDLDPPIGSLGLHRWWGDEKVTIQNETHSISIFGRTDSDSFFTSPMQRASRAHRTHSFVCRRRHATNTTVDSNASRPAGAGDPESAWILIHFTSDALQDCTAGI